MTPRQKIEKMLAEKCQISPDWGHGMFGSYITSKGEPIGGFTGAMTSCEEDDNNRRLAAESLTVLVDDIEDLLILGEKDVSSHIEAQEFQQWSLKWGKRKLRSIESRIGHSWEQIKKWIMEVEG